jgi:hypothetical protein
MNKSPHNFPMFFTFQHFCIINSLAKIIAVITVLGRTPSGIFSIFMSRVQGLDFCLSSLVEVVKQNVIIHIL